jgi:hypothetical protein
LEPPKNVVADAPFTICTGHFGCVPYKDKSSFLFYTRTQALTIGGKVLILTVLCKP